MSAESRGRSRARFLPFVLALLWHPLGRGQGCGAPPCAPNPTPCAQCVGTWTDNYGEHWTVNSPNWPSPPGTQSVSGSVVVPPPAPGCPSWTFTVSGTLTQTPGSATAPAVTSFSWTGSNPSPDVPCYTLNGPIYPVNSTFIGRISNNSCDNASGTWAHSDGSGSGNFTMNKPSDVASTEISQAVAWWQPYPTILLFEGQIASSLDLAGRQVFESANGTPSDSCYRSGDRLDDGTYLYPYQITGGGWFVGYYYFDGRYDYDYVGYPPSWIEYYRTHGRTPCQASAPQAMRIYTSGGSVTYYTNTLQIKLPDNTNVGVERGGLWGWRKW